MTEDLYAHVYQAPTTLKGMDCSDVHVGYLPGIVIFVHGVNSDGEWYEQCEEGLIEGLNERMGYVHAVQPERVVLRKASYVPELLPDGKIDRTVEGDTFITDPGRSPVIRFRWGYRAAGQDGTGTVDELEEYAGKIYLNELGAWGGGPFQNGTTALPYMWGEGMDDRLFWWVYANMLPVQGREIYASPPRNYYVHAAHRLKELIRAIRDKQEDCPITVVCHSQGNMVTLAAAFLGQAEGALADTYLLCNPPYNLDTSKMDALSNAEQFNMEGQSGGVTSAARQKTFQNFVKAVLARGRESAMRQTIERVNDRQRNQCPVTGEQRFELKPFSSTGVPQPYAKGQDRDNRGCVFLYCNPHDQVIGVSPVEGIGWKGLSEVQRSQLDPAGLSLFVRVWAQARSSEGFKVGDPGWARYNYIGDNHQPRFWNPPPPVAKYSLAYNPDQRFFSRVITTLAAPLLIVATRLFKFPLNNDPDPSWTVAINAPALPEPFAPESRRAASPGLDALADYGGRGDHDFDEATDPAWAYADKDGDFAKAHGVEGAGDGNTEAGLRYEINARLKMSQAGGRLGEGEQDMKTRTTQYLNENPNATDHSTIVGHAMHARRAIAYDVAVGWVDPGRITSEDLRSFRQFADWRYVKAADLPLSNVFHEYQWKGFIHGHQLFRTYTMDHMKTEAPGIVDERKTNALARLRG